MTRPDAQVSQSACRALLKPIASFLMKCGLQWREFAAISKSVFVEVASHEYGLRGRPTNISRVAILTGIGRKDVRKLREEADAQVVLRGADKATGATAVLAGWHQDPDFLDARGQPVPLTPDGNPRSFRQLCDRYAGDIPAVAMLKELKRVGAVEERQDQLFVTNRNYQPAHSDPQWVLSAANVFQDLGNNLIDPYEPGDGFCGSTIVAGQHDNLDPQFLQGADGRWRIIFEDIGYCYYSSWFIAVGDEHGGLALQSQFSGAILKILKSNPSVIH